MRKYVFLVSSCCLLAGELFADPLTFSINTLTGTIDGGFDNATFSGSGFSPSGDFITIGGASGHATIPYALVPGQPIQPFANFELDVCYAGGNCVEDGIAQIGGREYSVTLRPAGPLAVTAQTNLSFNPSALTYIVNGATATGEYMAYCDGLVPYCGAGTLLADVVIDLPGYVTANFVPYQPGVYRSAGSTFTSAPEPSSADFLLVSMGLASVALLAGGRKGVCGSVGC